MPSHPQDLVLLSDLRVLSFLLPALLVFTWNCALSNIRWPRGWLWGREGKLVDSLGTEGHTRCHLLLRVTKDTTGKRISTADSASAFCRLPLYLSLPPMRYFICLSSFGKAGKFNQVAHLTGEVRILLFSPPFSYPKVKQC